MSTEQNMNKKYKRIIPTFSFSLFFLLSACSSYNSSSIPQPDQPKINGAINCDYDQIEVSSITPVESEQDLEEELAGLEKIGEWTKGQEISANNQASVVYDFPVTLNPQVEFYLDLFQNKQKKYFKRWLERSTRYLPAIHRELKAAGLPQDLAYLAMIESGYNPTIRSHANAVGLWQFIRSTGQIYGLRIDSWVDERREPEKSTKAAVAYLRALYERFGDWQLAVAGYNAGEGKIERAIQKYNTRDFWELARHKYLRLETKRYVPKLIAAIMIARDPEQFGFTNLCYRQPEPYDLITVPPRTDLKAIAVSGATSVKKLQNLNNELRRTFTPPGSTSYALRIPAGSHDRIAANLTRLHPVVTTGYKNHRVRKGETVGRISRRYRISRTTLLKANRLRNSKLKIGQRLRIPYQTKKYVLLKKGQTPKEYYAATTGNSRMILHELRKGETLSKVSKQYNVPLELLIQWNNIKNVRKVRAGHQLAIYVAGKPLAVEKTFTETSLNDEIVLLAKAKRQPGCTSAKRPSVKNIHYYKVRSGDSLWTIARKFQVSTRDIRRWNGLRDNLIKPGKKLMIKES
jgi:membrane-bound lytic murein transglycosylase D